MRRAAPRPTPWRRWQDRSRSERPPEASLWRGIRPRGWSASHVARQLPGRSSRDPVTEQSYFHLCDLLVKIERHLLCEPGITYLEQQQVECLGADRVGVRRFVLRVDLRTVTRKLEEGRRVDHESRHRWIVSPGSPVTLSHREGCGLVDQHALELHLVGTSAKDAGATGRTCRSRRRAGWR